MTPWWEAVEKTKCVLAGIGMTITVLVAFAAMWAGAMGLIYGFLYLATMILAGP